LILAEGNGPSCNPNSLNPTNDFSYNNKFNNITHNNHQLMNNVRFKPFYGIRPSVLVKINGIEVSALLDSGATYVLMASELAEAAKVYYQPTNLWITTACNSRVQAKGTCEMQFEFQGLNRKTVTNVAESASCPLIIGMNAMSDCKLIVNTATRDISYYNFSSGQNELCDRRKPLFEFKTVIKEVEITENLIASTESLQLICNNNHEKNSSNSSQTTPKTILRA